MERADGLRPSPLMAGMWDCWSVDCQAADWLSRVMEARALIGWNLRRLRVAKGLSQERLALLAGIDRAYVGRVERGSENVTISTLEAMAVALAVPVAALLIEPEAGAQPPMPLRAGRRAKSG